MPGCTLVHSPVSPRSYQPSCLKLLFCFNNRSNNEIQRGGLIRIPVARRFTVKNKGLNYVFVVEVFEQLDLAQGSQAEHGMVERGNLFDGHLLTGRLIDGRAIWSIKQMKEKQKR